MNCWQYKKCGREPGGDKVKELGVCPAALNEKVDKIHDGKNGGRCCWVVSGTFCEGEIQGIYAAKLINCVKCDFYQKVNKEEGTNKINSKFILSKLN